MLQICFQANHSQDWVFKISKIIQNFDYKYISEHVLLCTQNCHLKTNSTHCTEVGFASLLSGAFTTMAVTNPPERKLAKHTSAQCRQKLRQQTAQA